MSSKERNKRLGQYFTGIELAKVLFEIASKINPKISSAIDPMMGKGDMLTAVHETDNLIQTYGIELDKQLKEQIQNINNKDSIITFGNAFEKNVLDKIGKASFDLVITNPPYVRHLNQKKASEFEDFIVPSSSQIQNELIHCLEENQSLKHNERKFLLDIARNYSGLSDLSVPSIIQCAALTEENGVLALVIPESCITREYSISTLLVLFKLFDIKVIVKDEGRKWFEDAQVKTLLLIGQKLSTPRISLESHPNISIIEVSGASSTLPLGDNSYSKNYKLFASSIFESKTPLNSCENFYQYFSSANAYLSPLISSKTIQKYPELNYFDCNISQNNFSLDSRLKSIVNCTEFIKLQDLSIEINQGLRTGANAFFYYDFLSEKQNKSKLYFNLKNESKIIDFPSDCLKPVLRKQKELPEGYFVSMSSLKGRLLVLNNYYTSEDIEQFKLESRDVIKLSIEVSEHIKHCATINIGSQTSPKYIPDLSAVRTNISQKTIIKKNWYHLPDLKKRHLPDICIPRVNSGLVKSFALEKNVVVDANFLTMNLANNSGMTVPCLIAILNSDWIKLQLELSGNVLGGGALKLDRNHLLNLLIPKPLMNELIVLDYLGKNLFDSINTDLILSKINELINSILKINNKTILSKLIEDRIKLRSKNG